MFRLISRISFLLAFTVMLAMPASALVLDPNYTVQLKLKYGTVVIRLRPDLAPKHVERIRTLTRQRFYDGQKFHRVIEGFMAQTGDPTGTGMGGSKLPDLKAEFNHMPFVRGTLGMARARSPDSANSQFFIVLADARHLDRNYTAFGEVVSGMEFVDKIAKGEPPIRPDRIISMRLVADIKKKE